MAHVNLGRFFFTGFILVVFLTAIGLSWDWPLRASILVLSLGAVAVVMLVVELLRESHSLKAATPRKLLDIATEEGEDVSLQRRRAIEFWAWIFGLLAGIWLLGFLASVTIYVFFYSWFYGRRPLLSVFLGLGAFAFAWVVFGYFLHVRWPDSLLDQWIFRR